MPGLYSPTAEGCRFEMGPNSGLTILESDVKRMRINASGMGRHPEFFQSAMAVEERPQD